MMCPVCKSEHHRKRERLEDLAWSWGGALAGDPSLRGDLVAQLQQCAHLNGVTNTGFLEDALLRSARTRGWQG